MREEREARTHLQKIRRHFHTIALVCTAGIVPGRLRRRRGGEKAGEQKRRATRQEKVAGEGHFAKANARCRTSSARSLIAVSSLCNSLDRQLLSTVRAKRRKGKAGRGQETKRTLSTSERDDESNEQSTSFDVPCAGVISRLAQTFCSQIVAQPAREAVENIACSGYYRWFIIILLRNRFSRRCKKRRKDGDRALALRTGEFRRRRLLYFTASRKSSRVVIVPKCNFAPFPHTSYLYIAGFGVSEISQVFKW